MIFFSMQCLLKEMRPFLSVVKLPFILINTFLGPCTELLRLARNAVVNTTNRGYNNFALLHSKMYVYSMRVQFDDHA